MPYRVDVRNPAADAFDRLVELGAIDAELVPAGISALMPDSVPPEHVGSALGVAAGDLSFAPAVGRDAASVWVLRPRPIRIGGLRIVPAHMKAEPDALRLVDARAFGTGLHPTTALCLEALEEAVRIASPDTVLDVGTGSGVLALAALMMGVPRAYGIDVEDEALRVAAQNARINALDHRLQLTCGGPDKVAGTWPLVVANLLPGPLIEMAPALVQRVGRRGRLILSGIPASVEEDVDLAYRHLGMRRVTVRSKAGWIALILQASW